MADHQEASLTLPSEPGSVRTARTRVLEILADWGLPGDAADAVRLIVSELTTNAVRHTVRSPTFTVELRLDDRGRFRLGVTDGDPRRPHRPPPAARQDGGRGLVIVGWLVAERGGRTHVEPTPQGGKTVWVTLPTEPVGGSAPVPTTAATPVAVRANR